MPENREQLDVFIWKNTPILVSLFFYIVPITLGLYFHNHLMKSPLLRFVGQVMGFFLSILTWAFAYLFSGIVLGNFEFASEVFSLRSQVDLRMAIACFVVCVPLTFFAKNLIPRAIPASSGKITSLILLLTIISTGFLAAEYMDSLTHWSAYVFSLCTIGGLHLWIFGRPTKRYAEFKNLRIQEVSDNEQSEAF